MVKLILGTLAVALTLGGCGKGPGSRPASRKSQNQATKNPQNPQAPSTPESLPAPDLVDLGQPQPSSSKTAEDSQTPTLESEVSRLPRPEGILNERGREDQQGPQSPSPSAADTSEEMPSELKQRVEREGQVALNKLTEQAQAAEKSIVSHPEKGSAQANWQLVLEFVTENGKHDSVAQGMEQFISVDDYSSEDRSKPYNRKMISLIGGMDSKGQFQFARVQAADEDWSRDSQGHDVGMVYLFLVGRDGTLAKHWLKRLVKNSTGSGAVIEDRYLELSQTDAEARWKLNQKYWFDRATRSSK